MRETNKNNLIHVKNCLTRNSDRSASVLHFSFLRNEIKKNIREHLRVVFIVGYLQAESSLSFAVQ